MRLTVLSTELGRIHGSSRTIATARCECGNLTRIRLASIQSGNTTSCGCLRKKHGLRNTPEYRAWDSMKQRCSNPKKEFFEHYGGRGIRVCDRWKDNFPLFYEDMGKRPSKKHSLDRINVDGNYEPSNCRWATQRCQLLNRRKSIREN